MISDSLESGQGRFVTNDEFGHVTHLECAHHDEVTFGHELGIRTFSATVEARVQLPFAQSERIERGVVGPRCRANV